MASLRTSLGCVALTGALAGGCFSLESLSSYSGGAGLEDDGAGAVDAGRGGGGGGGTAPDIRDASLGDADLDGGSAGEAVLDPSSVALEPAPAPLSGDACDAPGEIEGLAAGTCYLVLGLSSWLDARAECEAWGGDLVEITTPAENDFLSAEAGTNLWIGANDRQLEGEMVWSGGASVDYATWAPGQPDDFQDEEDCVERREPDGLWNDAPCDGLKRALCERSG